MKNFLIILFALIILGCKNEVSHTDLEKRGNTYYKIGETKPYTGTVYIKEGKTKTYEAEYKDGQATGKSTGRYQNGNLRWKKEQEHEPGARFAPNGKPISNEEYNEKYTQVD
ncbi:hypothetical protein DWW18_04735 [Butyricimonas virosa]|uniref:Uncharacterized protein n=1 Tax=Butyricimonas virosa TaxID=544645 RepID=A0A412X3V4_9BACT|nr:hypothetical protein [Butyricimonas virosa]RGV35384.1 hypothetical protein DWW18_04735 [Butyricimonas virosa]